MAIIKLNKITVGMILTADAKDLNNRTLLRAGSVFSEKNIKILKSWGITEAEVQETGKEDTDDSDGEDLKNGARGKAEKEIKPFFCHTNMSHPAIKELYNLSVSKKAQSISIEEIEDA